MSSGTTPSPGERHDAPAIREAAVLTGGGSRRMGREKALLELDGRPLIERSLVSLGSRFERLIVSVADEGPSPGVADVVSGLRAAGRDVDYAPDRRPGRAGPLAAVEAVLGTLRGPGAFVVAVDVPCLHFPLIEALCRKAASAGCLAVVPRWYGGLEPLYAVYGRGLRPLVSGLLDAGERSLRSVAGEPGVAVLEVRGPAETAGEAEGGSFLSSVPPAEVFRNLNTARDYSALRGDPESRRKT